jgi:hypothetical protein
MRSLAAALAFAAAFAATARSQDQVAGRLLQFQDNGAWCWFEDERAIVDGLRGKLLVGTVGDSSGLGGAARSGDIDVSWLDFGTGRFGSYELHNQLQADDHDSPAFLVRPDGRYLALYAKHSGDNLTRYRISTNPGDPSAWGPFLTYAHGASVSYSNVYHLRQTGRTYNFGRSVNYDPNVMLSLDQGATWTATGKLLTEGGAGDRPYARYASDDLRRIHVLVTNRHPRNFDNSIFHGYVENDRLHKSDGTVVDANILDGAGMPPSALSTVYATGTVSNGTVMRRGWTIDLEADAGDRVRALLQMRANDSNADHRLFFAQWDGATWNAHEVCRLGAYLYAAEDDYTGLAALHPDRTDTIYVSTKIHPSSGAATSRYEIYRGVTPDGGASWAWTAITQNSSVDNLRPIVPAWDAQRTALLWMRGTYSSYTDFDMAAVGVIEAPELTFGTAAFVDATPTNTTLADGSAVVATGPASGQGATDGQWHRRSGYGNGGDVWASSETTNEDAPTLRTRATGVSGAQDVFLVFWSNPNEDWTLQAGFAPGQLRNYQKRGAAGLENAHFTAPLVTTIGSTRAYSIWIGRATPDAQGNLDVYVDDLAAGQDGTSRTWYDGIALAPVATTAGTQKVGYGCGGNAEIEALGVPQLGGAMHYSVTGATPGSLAVGALGLGWLVPAPLLGFAGCTLFVDPIATVALGIVAANGASPQGVLALPNDPALRAFRLAIQAGALGAGLQLTQALVLTLGS